MVNSIVKGYNAVLNSIKSLVMWIVKIYTNFDEKIQNLRYEKPKKYYYLLPLLIIYSIIVVVIKVVYAIVKEVVLALYVFIKKIIIFVIKFFVAIYKLFRAIIMFIILCFKEPKKVGDKFTKFGKGFVNTIKHPKTIITGSVKAVKSQTFKGYMYLLPALLVITIFTFYPFISAFLMGFVSFTDDLLPGAYRFNYYDWSIFEVLKRLLSFDKQFYNLISFNNFIYVLKHKEFWIAMKNTTIIVIVSVPISIIISLLIAVGLNSIPKLKGLFQTVYFLPYVTSMVAVVTVWRWFFYKDYNGTSHGLINYFMGLFGASPIDWLNGQDGAHYQLVAFIIYSVWSAMAFKIVIFLTGLQNINKQYYDAAKVDGASRFRIFTKITVPQLSPIILFVSITSMIGAFKVFTSVQAMFNDTPGLDNSVLTIVYYVYKKMRAAHYDTAAAAAVILFIFILFLTTIQLSISKKKVHY